MNIYAVIKKYTLSEFAGTTYWGQFNLLTELQLSDEQFLKLINFYSTMDSYRSRVIDIMSFSDGHGYKFVSGSDSLTVYSYFALIDPATTLPIIRSGEDYDNFVTARDILFAELGWMSYDEHVATIAVTFNKETNQFVGIPDTYADISQLYQTSPSLETFLGN
jgi:hypothetical protein